MWAGEEFLTVGEEQQHEDSKDYDKWVQKPPPERSTTSLTIPCLKDATRDSD